MLGNRRVAATIPAADLDRAKKWYSEKLGLNPSQEMDAGAFYKLGEGTAFLLYPTVNAGSAPNTLMTFESRDVDGDVAALKERGVSFIDMTEGDLQTVNSIVTMGELKAAWFKDSEGNILAIGNAPT